ncbi:FG-GAP-like repeat-containing protein [Nibrella viscosa]|uniref:FG-GAP-like repeat-containing protein n=1 Tax=Nibrella viscosa TaxID=1084524 RepID=A0ABP8K822_9BACT
MKTLLLLTAITFLTSISYQPAPPVRFSRYFVAAESYESVGIVDVNKDGRPDLVSGDFWYENSADLKALFRKRHLIGNQKRFDQYYDDFSTIPLDVNRDGNVDIITGGWFGATLRWLENPGPTEKDKPWTIHEIANVGNVETVRAWDIDGDSTIEIVPNNPNHPLKYFKLGPNATFSQINVAPTQGHGLGFGDVNGDGKGDFIVSDGWLEAPNWTLHKEFSLGTASVPILVVDVNGDKKNDLIVGQGHGYGLHWYEQTINEQGRRSWKKNTIDDKNSQYHVMEWADITGDGKPELITGKRYRAHNDNDAGAYDNVGLYYFTWTGKAFEKHTISYGQPGVGKGTGIYFALADLRNTGRPDIIVAGKDGLEIFFNEGR